MKPARLVADLRAIIVDDEPPARARVRDLLAAEPGIVVVREASNGEEAVRVIEREAPDLVFLDVQMPVLDGFGVLASLATPPAAVIFVTAFDTYALRAFEVHALDYLLKPFDRERFHLAVERARTTIRSHPEADDPRMVGLLKELLARDRHLSRVVVKSRGRMRVVPLDEVEWIEASGNYLRLHTPGGRHLMRETLSGIESRLDPARFARIHRSVIVNLCQIRELVASSHGDCRVTLASGAKVPLSRTYRERLKDRLGPEL